jgi:ABC-type transport auxiliary lipoprotein component
VREFDAPGFLKEGAIAYRVSATRLGFYSYHRWAVDPRRSASMGMIEELRARGVFRSATPFDGRGSADWILTGAIDHLEEVDDGSKVSVIVALSAQLANDKTGEIAWQGSSS